MTNNTKQSEETHIEWRIMGNPVLSGEATPETILTIHPDGRVTTSDRLKPTETAALVLDQIKTHWMRDSQATTIRELQDRIKRLEEAIQERDKEWFQVIESILGFHPVSMTEALRIGIERIKKQKQRIKRLEELGKELRECAGQLGWTSSDDSRWIQRAEAAVKAWDKEAKP